MTVCLLPYANALLKGPRHLTVVQRQRRTTPKAGVERATFLSLVNRKMEKYQIQLSLTRTALEIAVNIKQEHPDQYLTGVNTDAYAYAVFEGSHLTPPPHEWDGNNTYNQHRQPIQATLRNLDRFRRPSQATRRSAIRQSVHASMSPNLQGEGYFYNAFPDSSNNTYVPADPIQAERFQPYAAISAQHLNSREIQRCDNSRHNTPHSPYHPPNIYSNMSLSYESRSFMPESNYPMGMEHQAQEEMHTRYPSPPPPLSENPYNAPNLESPVDDAMENLPNLPSHESDAPSPGRSKPIPKPAREVTKGDNGRYFCSWVGCTEEIRDFARKCEWSKHMDKHDRPYKCPADGCEKLPGFTYSGGLLRHEREVHGKHGGPRKQLNCPHPNCKRHTGKGFSRQENLNEHLRRVHTDAGAQDGEATEEEEETKPGQKRKRTTVTSGRDDVREELKRLRVENEELKKNLDVQTAQTNKMMQQIAQLQANQQQAQLQASIQQQQQRMPQASML